MTIEEQLENYADLLERQEMLQKQMQELLDKVPVPQEIVDQWNAIKAEFRPMIDAVTQSADELKQLITQNVITLQQTSKGSRYMAVYISGKTSWNGKALEGFAMAHPEILQARSLGSPSVTFRKVK